MNMPGRTNLPTLMALAVLVSILAALSAACGGESKELTLDEYLDRMDCESLGEATEEEPETYGEFSASMSVAIDRMSPLVPPADIAEWHRTVLGSLRELKAELDSFPKDDEIDLIALAGLLGSFEETNTDVDEVVSRMPDDVRQRMTEADCL